MKYQIYLNKKTSDFINKASKQSNMKQATFIKQMIEGIIEASYKAYETMEESFKLATKVNENENTTK